MICIPKLALEIQDISLLVLLLLPRLDDNQFIFGKHAMQTLTESGYIPEELFSQKGSMAEDAKFNKTLMADLSRQARRPMIVTSADAAYCYDCVNHIIMSLV